MINKKNEGLKSRFWEHFHHLLDISQFGNEKIVERLDSYSSIDDFFEKNFLLANIPEKYFKLGLEEFRNMIQTMEKNIAELEKIEKYLQTLDKANKNGIGLYISGPHGVGKTGLAIVILKAAIMSYYPSFFSRSTEIIEFARSGWKNDDKKSYWSYVVNNSDFFVIDDIGRLFSQLNEAERIHIDEIFTKRDDSNLCTIITANHTLEINKDLYGEALYSNFRERLIEVKLIGEDYRNVIGDSLLDKLS